MLIHSFVTDGYYDFATGMLVSFKYHHGVNIPFVLHSKDLSEEQQEKLHDIYPKLTIFNTATDWDWIVEKSEAPLKVIVEGKKRVEDLTAKYNHRGFAHWKHYISIVERYKRSLSELFKYAKEGEHILHLDIDMFVNKNFDSIFNMISHADVCVLLRPGAALEWRKTFGCILGFTVNDASRRFLDVYHTHLNAIPFKDIPKGYGQTALWRAYQQVRKDKSIRIADIPTNWVSKGFDKKAYLFAAHLGKPKTMVAKMYRDMAKKRTNVPPPNQNFRIPAVENNEGKVIVKARKPQPVRRRKPARARAPRPVAKVVAKKEKSKPADARNPTAKRGKNLRSTSSGLKNLRPSRNRGKRKR